MVHVADRMTRCRQSGGQFRIGLLAGDNLLLIALDAGSEFNIRPDQAVIVHARAASSTEEVYVWANEGPIGRIASNWWRLGVQRSGAEQESQTEGRHGYLK